jgi:hypothetical protein
MNAKLIMIAKPASIDGNAAPAGMVVLASMKTSFAPFAPFAPFAVNGFSS